MNRRELKNLMKKRNKRVKRNRTLLSKAKNIRTKETVTLNTGIVDLFGDSCTLSILDLIILFDDDYNDITESNDIYADGCFDDIFYDPSYSWHDGNIYHED